MAKLSEQISQDVVQPRPTRTERVLQATELKEEQKAEAKLRSATYENYEDVYNSISEKYRGRFISPSELKKTEGYKTYLEEKQKQQEIDDWKQAFDDYSRRDRAFFLGLDPSKERLRKFQEVKKAFEGKQSSVPDYVFGELKGTVSQTRGAPRLVYGLEPGEIVTSTVRTKEGEIKSEKVYQKILNDEGEPQIKYSVTGYKQEEIPSDKESEKIYLDYKIKDVSQFGYVTRGTMSNQTQPIDLVPMTATPEKSQGKIMTKITAIYERFPIYVNLPSTTIPSTKDEKGIDKITKLTFSNLAIVSPVKVSDSSLNLVKVKEGVQTNILKKQQSLFLSEITRTGVLEKLEPRFQEEYQTKFERKYGEDVASGKITFEEASELFAESDEAKIINQKFEAAIRKEREGKPMTKEGWAVAGLGFAGIGVSLVPATVPGAITEGALLYSGTKVLKAVPTKAVNIATAGFGVSGVVKAVSPKSTPEEKASGVITAGISFSILGYQGIKYLRQPTIKYAKIKVPKADVSSAEVIGRDVKIIGKEGEVTNKVLFGNQKLSQTTIAGRRTIVSTRFRDIFGLEPVYKGVPYAEKGTTYVLQSLRGTYTYTTPSAYNKAFDLLVKRGGFSESQATRALRYYQPRFIEQYLSKGVLTVKGQSATGEFTYLTKQPTILIDETLGIKTRGARTIKDIYTVERKLVSLKTGTLAVEDSARISFYLKRGQTPFAIKDFQISKGILAGRVSGTRKGFELLKTDVKGLSAYKEITYKDISGLSIRRDIFPSSRVINIEGSRTKLINEIVDLQDKNIYSLRGIGGGAGKSIGYVGSGGTSETQAVSKVKDLIKLNAAEKSSQVIAQVNKNILKAVVTPEKISTTQKVANVITSGQKFKTLSDVALLSATGSKVKEEQKLSPALRLNAIVQLKNLIKEDTVLKQSQSGLQAQALLSQQVQMQINESDLIRFPGVSVPIATPPKIPVIPIVPIVPIIPPQPKSTKKKKGKRVSVEELAYVPDFTSKILGLGAVEVSEKQATARIKKILTGLELRRPIKITNR